MTRKLTVLLGALLASAALAAPSQALAAPVLEVRMSHDPSGGLPMPTSGHVMYIVAVSNSGDIRAGGPITVDFDVPAGVRVVSVRSEDLHPANGTEFAWRCSIPDSQSASCTGPASGGEPGPGEEACVRGTGSTYAAGRTCRIHVTVRADPALQPGDIVTPAVEACGGGAVACANASDPTQVTGPLDFGITSFSGGAFALNGDPVFDLSGPEVTSAGSHPQTASTAFTITEQPLSDGYMNSVEIFKDVIVDLPPGLIGNPQSIPSCSDLEMRGGGYGQQVLVKCPIGSQVGMILANQNGNLPGYRTYLPLFKMEPPQGRAALFGFVLFGTSLRLTADLIPDSSVPGGYRIRAATLNTPAGLNLRGAGGIVWGVPADPSNDADRGWSGGNEACAGVNDPCSREPPIPSPEPRRAFFTLPTSCDGPVQTDIFVNSWQGSSDTASFLSPAGTDCASLPFAPRLSAKPTTNVADSPSGLDVELHVPQDTFTDPDNQVTAHLKDTTVVLPEGMNVNPSSANGLDACSSAQIDISGNAPDNCPPASKLGTVSVDTPLLENTVPGSVYLARPYDNPFNSLLAIYIAIDDPISGTVVKIAGHVKPDPVTGQLTTVVKENPQLPFEDLNIRFFGGAGGSLRTPAVCGDYATESEMTPWSGTAPVDSSDPWRIEQGPQGTCSSSKASLPHAPSFDAGTISPIAGAHSPFVVNLRRDDGSQEFSAVTVSPPQGLLAKLAGTATCPDSSLAAAASKSGREEQANPSCPTASEIGSVSAAAGAGPAPYNAPGKVYLSGPHKGAPLSLSTIVPATAGPFDLGTVVTKIALHVNAKTSEVTAVSDPIPHILQGIVLDVRNVHVAIDKPDFMLNPTSCDPMSINGALTSTLGAIAPLQARFQLAECTRLGFKPKLTLSLKGGTKRGDHPALTVMLQPRPGDANISSFSIAFPRSEFLENAHIRTICTRPAFAADQCPSGAIYGEATVHTPILDYPLTGHLYLRSSDNLLPDVVPDLRGPAYQPIRIESAARTDSIRGGIRNTVDFVPDAPFSKLLVRLQGGNKGLLVNSRDICRRTYRATVRYTAHNGLTYIATPALRAKCGKKGKKKGKRGGHKRR